MLGYVFAVFAVCLALTVPVGITMGISAMVPHFLNPAFPAKICNAFPILRLSCGSTSKALAAVSNAQFSRASPTRIPMSSP